MRRGSKSDYETLSLFVVLGLLTLLLVLGIRLVLFAPIGTGSGTPELRATIFDGISAPAKEKPPSDR